VNPAGLKARPLGAVASREQTRTPAERASMARKKQSQIDWKDRLYIKQDDYRDNFALSREGMRIEFLRAVRSVEPAVLSSLAKHVLPLYPRRNEIKTWIQLESAVAREFTPIALRWIKSKGYVPEIEFKHLGAVKLREMLRAWAKSWLLAWDSEGGIENIWVLNYALETLLLWREEGTQKKLDWAYISWDVSIGGQKLLDRRSVIGFDESQGFKFIHPPYAKDMDSWSDYRKRIEKAFQERLEEYRAQVCPSAKDKGLGSKRKSEHTGPSDLHWHYKLLALNQIHHPDNPFSELPFRSLGSNRRLRGEDLAQQSASEKSASGEGVRQGIIKTAKGIGFTIYARKRGPR